MRSPVPILDCHGHIGTHPDFPAYKIDPLDMVRVMDLLNIESLAITSTRACYNDCPRGNQEIDLVLRTYPGRFRGYITVNPNPEGEALRLLEQFAHFHKPPLIKLHPYLHRYPINGPKYAAIWDYANQTHAIVLVHTWESDRYCCPLLLTSLARQFPHARILIGHGGVTWRGYEQSIEVAKTCPNTYIDIAGSQSHRIIVEHCVRVLGDERILFGSDMPFLEPSVSLGRVMTARIQTKSKIAILRENFLRLLT